MLAVSGGWGIEVGHIKVVVKIPDTIYPELVADLERVQLRDRAERVRVLAMIGLRSFGTLPNTSMTSNRESDQPHEEHLQNTRAMIRSLTESL